MHSAQCKAKHGYLRNLFETAKNLKSIGRIFRRIMNNSQNIEGIWASGVSADNAIQPKLYRWQFRCNSNMRDEIEKCESLAKAMETPAALELAGKLSALKEQLLQRNQDLLRANMRQDTNIFCQVGGGD